MFYINREYSLHPIKLLYTKCVTQMCPTSCTDTIAMDRETCLPFTSKVHTYNTVHVHVHPQCVPLSFECACMCYICVAPGLTCWMHHCKGSSKLWQLGCMHECTVQAIHIIVQTFIWPPRRDQCLQLYMHMQQWCLYIGTVCIYCQYNTLSIQHTVLIQAN